MQSFQGFAAKLILFGLCVVFALQFGGPQARGCTEKHTGFAAKVWDQSISEGDFRAAYLLAGGDRLQPEMAEKLNFKTLVLYGLIERTLLARQARKIGYNVTEEDILKTLAEDGTIYVSMSVKAPPFLQSGPQHFDFSDKNGNFNKEHLKRFVLYQLHRSIAEFTENQADEKLAQMVRDLISSSVQVNESEVWNVYQRDNEKVTLKYLRFSPVYYQGRLEATDQQIDEWAAANQSEVNAEYQRQKQNYTGLEKQVRARHLLIKVANDAKAEQKEAARKQALELLARAKKGEDFAELARRYSQDPGSARKGGDLGFNPRGRMVAAFDDAQFAMRPGQISNLVETDFGFHIIKVEAIRQGDVPEAEAKREVAKNLWLERAGKQQAKEAAEKALARLREGVELEALETELAGRGAAQIAEAKPAAGEPSSEPDPLAPQVRDTMPFSRLELPVHGPFDSRPLVEKAFELSEEKPLGKEPIQLGDDWFVYRLQSRTHAKREKFTGAEREQAWSRLLAAKRRNTLAGYVNTLLKEAEAANALRINVALSTGPSPEPEF